MTSLYVHGPATMFNAAPAATWIPQGAQVWLYGDNTRDFFPSIGWHVVDPGKAVAMLDDAVVLIGKREGASTCEPLAIVLHDVEDEFLDRTAHALRTIHDQGPAVNVHLAVTTRYKVEWLASLVDEVLAIDDYESIADIALNLAGTQHNHLAEQNLLSMAQVYMTKALLQELRNSRS